MGKQRKIDTSGETGLEQNPFDTLSSAELPRGPGQRMASPKASAAERRPGNKGRVDVVREKSGRGGKTVTVVRNIPANTTPQRELEQLLAELKKRCACGGTLKGRDLEIQGDVRDAVKPLLEARGFRVIFAGG